METNLSSEIELLLKTIAKRNNISWDDAKFFFNMGFYEGKMKTLLGEMK